MKFDPTSKDVVLISYPSGGFGNFLYHALTEYSSNTTKIKNDNFNFGIGGNSHATKKYTNIYFKEPDVYHPTLININPEQLSKILVLCDNGINNDSYEKINIVFPNATIVRICISDRVRSIVYQTCVTKAMDSDVYHENQKFTKKQWSDADEDYAQRENITLMYHNWPFAWAECDQLNVINVDIELLVNNTAQTIATIISQLNGEVLNYADLESFCNKWRKENDRYFKIYYEWDKISAALLSDNDMDLSHVTDLHSQGYINYCIEKMYSVTIPVYDYKNWFTSTNLIVKFIKDLHEKNNTDNQ
jgi:hypothetical protein